MKNLFTNVQKGQHSEHIAFCFLEKAGYDILETNWRFGRLEIDIICRKGRNLVFVEVKSRMDNKLGSPSAAVSSSKKKFLVRAAYKYMEKNKYDGNFRFDIITTTGYNNATLEIEHYQDCFFPGL